MVKAIPTTKKIACFKYKKNISRKGIETVGGIDAVLGCRLRKQGITTATALKTRTHCMTRCQFKDWMKKKVCANGRYSGMAYKSLYVKVTRKTIKRKLTQKPKKRCIKKQ